jgi:hypothetical protein
MSKRPAYPDLSRYVDSPDRLFSTDKENWPRASDKNGDEISPSASACVNLLSSDDECGEEMPGSFPRDARNLNVSEKTASLSKPSTIIRPNRRPAPQPKTEASPRMITQTMRGRNYESRAKAKQLSLHGFFLQSAASKSESPRQSQDVKVGNTPMDDTEIDVKGLGATPYLCPVCEITGHYFSEEEVRTTTKWNNLVVRIALIR